MKTVKEVIEELEKVNKSISRLENKGPDMTESDEECVELLYSYHDVLLNIKVANIW